MIRYSRLGYVALNVSDLERSSAFYGATLGLQEIETGASNARFFRCSDQQHDIVLFQGTPGIKRIGFELESASQLEPLRAALSAAGCAYSAIPHEDCRAMATGEGIRTADPGSGGVLDFYVGAPFHSAAPAYQPTVANILRLGHVVVASEDYPRSLDFYTRTLNFKVSDAFDGAVSFLRCFPNPYHHSFGIGNGAKTGSGLKHVAFMVGDIDDIGRSYWRLQKAGVPVVHGPGRHLPSGSVFLYFLDPDGMTIEYTLGMEEFPEEGPRDPRNLPFVPESNDIWGSAQDRRKGTVGTVEQYQP